MEYKWAAIAKLGFVEGLTGFKGGERNKEKEKKFIGEVGMTYVKN